MGDIPSYVNINKLIKVDFETQTRHTDVAFYGKVHKLNP